MYLQNKIVELRCKVAEKQVNEDVIAALKTEICELKQSAFMKTNSEQEIAGLRKEVNPLRDQNERVVLEIGQWKEQALRPGNKRGSVVLQTPDVSNRGSPKPGWTDNVREEGKWKAEYRNIQSLHRLANIEVEALKEKRVEGEARRMEAEKQVKVLEEKMGQLMVSGEKGIGKGKSVEVVSGDSAIEEAARLRKENEDLKRKLSEALYPVGDDRVMHLQNEIVELCRKVGEKQVNEDVIAALKTEICELKKSAFIKTNFKQEIAGLRKKVNLLRDQNERAVLKIGQWKEQALRPGNKGDSVVLQTPDVSNQGSPKPQWTDNVREEDQWKAWYRNLQSLHRLANIEAEALKEKRAEARARRMEAENQVRVWRRRWYN
ncbi:hypothetical protein CBR_g31489 [Chara braunii]|uniref:Uncharacterized protein n=1 Tax=Chara braunii TaxID=69332 RepID=A0A388LFE3_CHABU|nr:hypothetical protein CBR_g31489 [Chara braunii]|eukprot:GBG80933.1 hypothetical protein CBR_g31489 [Chara braunii]